MLHLLGRAGHVAGYDVLITGETVSVTLDCALIAPQTVPNDGMSLAALSVRPLLPRLGRFPRWGRGSVLLRQRR